VTSVGTLLAGALACALSAAVALGWLLRIPELIQLRPGLVPMQMNAALASLAGGLGLLTAGRPGPGRRVGAALGAGALGIAVATLVEHLAGIDLRIDQALVEDWIGAGGAHPGRMAPHAAVALALAGAGLVAAGRFPGLAALLGGLCAAIGITGLLGYATGIDPAYAWGVSMPMAPATGACLALVGGGLFALAFGVGSERPRTSWWSALVVGIAAASVTLLFWQALVRWDEAQFRRFVGLGATRVEGEIRSRLEMRMEALAIFAREWEGRLFRMRGGWESDVRLALSQSQGLVAVEWIDAGGKVDWVYPKDVRLPAPALGPLLADPRNAARPALSGPFELGGRRPAFRILAPLIESDEVEGWLAGTFQAPALFGEILANLDASVAVEVYAGDQLLFHAEGRSSELQDRWTAWRKLDLPGMDLRIRVQPSSEMIRASRSLLPPVFLGGGLAMSALLGLAVGLRGLAASRARALDLEAHAHEEAAREVGRLASELEARVLARTAELARSNEELKDFAAFLSHELRQPLSTLAVWIDLLGSRYADTLDGEGRRYLSELRSVAGRLSDLLEAQLALSAINRSEFEPGLVDLASLAREVARELKPDLDAAGASVEIGSLPVVEGDPQQLRQLVRNLLENAIKYRSPERPLRVQIEGGAENGSGWMRVGDNGRGFSPSEAQRIFDISVRLQPDSGPGHGIGLALCRRIAMRHGGSIRAEAEPGRGAAFTVHLARAQPGGGASTRRAPPA